MSDPLPAGTIPPITPLRDVRIQNLSDLELDLSSSPNVKSNGAVELPLYDFPKSSTNRSISFLGQMTAS